MYLSVGVTDILAAVLVGQVQRVAGPDTGLWALDQEGVVFACTFPPSAITIHHFSSQSSCPMSQFHPPLFSACAAPGNSGTNIRVTAQMRSEERGFCATDMFAVCCEVGKCAFSAKLVVLLDILWPPQSGCG